MAFPDKIKDFDRVDALRDCVVLCKAEALDECMREHGGKTAFGVCLRVRNSELTKEKCLLHCLKQEGYLNN